MNISGIFNHSRSDRRPSKHFKYAAASFEPVNNPDLSWGSQRGRSDTIGLTISMCNSGDDQVRVSGFGPAISKTGFDYQSRILSVFLRKSTCEYLCFG